MTISITRHDLLALLVPCQGVVDKKSLLPGIASVLLRTEGGSLRVSATDMYLSVSDKLPVHGDINAALPAAGLLERVKAMPEGMLTITIGENYQATIKAAGSPRRFTLRGIPGSEFPVLPEPSGEAAFTIPAATLSKLFARTAFSISTDETRPHVNSLLVEIGGHTIRCVSTDGHRLNKAEATVEGTLPKRSMMLPLKAVVELRRLLDKTTGDVIVSSNDPHAFFAIGSATFGVKLIDAAFPPYAQVIPKFGKTGTHVARSALANAVQAVAIAASERTHGVKLTFAGDVLRIESESPDSGNAYDELPIDDAGVGAVTVGFNWKYLLDVLSVIDGDEVVLNIKGDLDPMVIRPDEDEDGFSYLAVVMPMKV